MTKITTQHDPLSTISIESGTLVHVQRFMRRYCIKRSVKNLPAVETSQKQAGGLEMEFLMRVASMNISPDGAPMGVTGSSNSILEKKEDNADVDAIAKDPRMVVYRSVNL